MVVNAYELLKDPERKRIYDLTGEDGPRNFYLTQNNNSNTTVSEALVFPTSVLTLKIYFVNKRKDIMAVMVAIGHSLFRLAEGDQDKECTSSFDFKRY